MKIYITIATMYYKSINEQQRNVFRHIIILLLICMKLRNVSYWCFHSTIFLFDIIAIFSIFCGFLLFAFSATAGGCLENNSMNDIHALQLLNRVILKRCFGVEMNEYRNEIWYMFSADLKLDFFTSYFFKLHLRNYHIRISR